MIYQSPTAVNAAAEVRAEMARQRKTGVGLAEALGLSQQTVSRRLTGQITFSLDELDRVAVWLGVDVLTFFPEREAS
jgi:transcriptional regulator with XRE-family HTH domain